MENSFWLVIAAVLIPVAACQDAPSGSSDATGTSLFIPSDSNANYFIVEKGGTGSERTIITKRVGSSGTGYSKRLYNCTDKTVKYLGTGGTLEQMNASQADPKMAPIVPGSIAHFVGIEACEQTVKPTADSEAELKSLTMKEEAREQAEANECRSARSVMKAEHLKLVAARKYWDASLSIRRCASLLDDKELKRLLSEAEAKAYVQDIRDPKTTPREKIQAIEALLVEHPSEGKKYKSRLAQLTESAAQLQGEAVIAARRYVDAKIGMSQQEVLETRWGQPSRVNRTTTSSGVSEQWVYDSGYLYFKNGCLTTIQE